MTDNVNVNGASEQSVQTDDNGRRFVKLDGIVPARELTWPRLREALIAAEAAEKDNGGISLGGLRGSVRDPNPDTCSRGEMLLVLHGGRIYVTDCAGNVGDGRFMLGGAYTGLRMDMTGSYLWSPNFYAVDFSSARFVGAEIANATFDRCNLRDADFARVKMVGDSSFTGAVLTGAAFQEATLVDVGFYGADLKDASFYGANLEGARIHNSLLAGANFARAKFDVTRGHNSRLDVLPMLGANWRLTNLSYATQALAVRMDASCYGSARRFAAMWNDGVCPYGGYQRVHRAVQFVESGRQPSRLLREMAGWRMLAGTDRMVRGAHELHPADIPDCGTPNPLALLLMLMWEHGCTLKHRLGTMDPTDGQPMADAVMFAMMGLNDVMVDPIIVDPTAEEIADALGEDAEDEDEDEDEDEEEIEYEVEVTRTVVLRGTRTDASTVRVMASSAEEAEEMVSRDPEGYVGHGGWTFGDEHVEDDDCADNDYFIDEVREA